MSSRSAILERIRKVDIAKSPLPEIPVFHTKEALKPNFIQALEANQVEVISCHQDQVRKHIKKVSGSYGHIVSMLPEYLASTAALPEITQPHGLENTELAIIKSDIGVAENGAIWIPEDKVGHRILPFITLHLLVVIGELSLVPNMHEAYRKINPLPGFGVFVAGPSKTADIEQTLVIGAHGPKKMTVIVVEK